MPLFLIFATSSLLKCNSRSALYLFLKFRWFLTASIKTTTTFHVGLCHAYPAYTPLYEAVSHLCWPSIKPTQFQWVVSLVHDFYDRQIFISIIVNTNHQNSTKHTINFVFPVVFSYYYESVIAKNLPSYIRILIR